jgi:hypothetical protein
LGADALLQERNLPGHRRLREAERMRGGREGAVSNDRPECGELADIKHAESLER